MGDGARRLLPLWVVSALLATAAPAIALPVTFGNPDHRGVGVLPRAIAVDDFDGDADPDIAVANEGIDADGTGDSVSVLLGGAAATFGSASTLAAGDEPRAIASGIFSSGLDPDLVVANFDDDNVSVLLGSTLGTFDPQTTEAAGDGPRGIGKGLFNSGAIEDIAVANNNSDDVSVLLGATDGNFTGPVAYAAGDAPISVAVADFNGDLDPDLAVANLASDDVTILLGDAGGTFAPAGAIAAGDAPRLIVRGDFNADGDPDLAVANESSDDVSVMLGTAGASFSAAVSFAVGDAPRSVVAADITRDGNPDLATANTQSDDVSVLVGKGDGTFAAALAVPAGDGPWSIAAADFDVDGEGDLVVANIGSDDVSILVNTTAPDTAITSGPTGITGDTTPTFELTADEPGATFTCQMDTAPAEACTSPFTPAALPDGPHTVTVTATDPAGNADATPATRAFSTDGTAPETAVDGPSGATADSTPTFGFSANEGGTFSCRLDGAEFATCTAPFTTAALPDGAHTFDVRATDGAGNVDPSPASRAITVDTAAPDTTLTSGPTGNTTRRKPTFAFSSTETGSTFECRVDDAAFASCTSPLTTATLAKGKHTFEVRATDAVGNRDASPATRSFTALIRIRADVDHLWSATSSATTALRLVANDLPSGTRVQLRCRGRGCPFKKRKVKIRRKRANALGLLRGRQLRPGSVLELRITASNAIGQVVRFRIRSADAPKDTTLCLNPGSSKPRKKC